MTTQLAASATSEHAPLRAYLAHVGDIVLSTDTRQRRCLTVLLLATAIGVIFNALMAYGAALGVMSAQAVSVLGALSLATAAVFYAVIRSGLNQRCADPTLAYPQTLAAQGLIAGVYAVAGPLHSASLILLALVMVFGMFNMRPEAVRAVCVYTIVSMAFVMAWCHRTDPVNYPAFVEWFNFAVVVTVLPAISYLSGQLRNMRTRLKRQKTALQNALTQIQELATRDELTGLPNRRHMMNVLHEHALRRARGGPPFYVGMLDLDHFKDINDNHGHAIGDECLRTFAMQARAALHTTDVVGRWGGEEFLVILPANVPGEPDVAIERLRTALAKTPACALAPGLHILFSAGLTRYRDGEPATQAVERADRALYQAKSAGRNRTVAG